MKVCPTSVFRSAHWTSMVLISELIILINTAQPSRIIRTSCSWKINTHPLFRIVIFKLCNSEHSQGHKVGIMGLWGTYFLCFNQNTPLSTLAPISYIEGEIKLHYTQTHTYFSL